MNQRRQSGSKSGGRESGRRNFRSQSSRKNFRFSSQKFWRPFLVVKSKKFFLPEIFTFSPFPPAFWANFLSFL